MLPAGLLMIVATLYIMYSLVNVISSPMYSVATVISSPADAGRIRTLIIRILHMFKNTFSLDVA